MYITKSFVSEVNAIRQQFVGELPYTEVIQKLEVLLKKFRAKATLFLDDRPKNDYAVGGMYRIGIKRRPISIDICLSARHDKLKLGKKAWRHFIFLVTQIIHHEHIHLCQHSHRQVGQVIRHLRLDNGAEKTPQQDYLSDPDEIAAYAHDIAMEMVFHFPEVDPLCILKQLEKFKLGTFDQYQTAFAGTEWSEIRKELKKQVFRWLAYYTE